MKMITVFLFNEIKWDIGEFFQGNMCMKFREYWGFFST
jgi:hypothetical protein